MGIGEPLHRRAGPAGQFRDEADCLGIRRIRVLWNVRDEAAERLLGALQPLVGGGLGGCERGDQLGCRRLGLRRLRPLVERRPLRRLA